MIVIPGITSAIHSFNLLLMFGYPSVFVYHILRALSFTMLWFVVARLSVCCCICEDRERGKAGVDVGIVKREEDRVIVVVRKVGFYFCEVGASSSCYF